MTSSKSPRFHFLDALRGIAAISVVLHHLFFTSVMTTIYEAVSPHFVRFLFQVGASGVEIFFVLSGFVIAHSLRNNSLSLADIGRFIVRRQVRLDPPYWAALVLGMGWLWLRNHLPGVVRVPLPSGREVALNATYLQNIFHLPEEGIVLGVAWTLCLEIQFYLLFIAILWLCHDTPRRREAHSDAPEATSPPISNRAVVVVWASAALCLLMRHLIVDPHAIYFWTAWHYFAAGVLAYWAVTRKVSGFWIATLLGAFTLSWIIGQIPAFSAPLKGTFAHTASHVGIFVGAATALSLWQLGIRDKLGLWENVRPLQYLGRISYSLYLTHLIVVLMVLRLGYKVTKSNVPAAFLWMLVAGALSIGVAHLFYLLIERPSQRWTRALSKDKATPPQALFTPVPETTTEPAL